MKFTSEFCFLGSQLEDLPNELFFLVFSYLKSDMVIQTFIDLNQRFQSLIHQSMRHLVLSPDTTSNSIQKYFKSIEYEIETLTLSIDLISVLFSGKYSYSNLQLLTIYSDIDWRVELSLETISPIVAVVQALKTLDKCSFADVRKHLDKLLKSEDVQRALQNNQTSITDGVMSYSAIRRLWIYECNERDLWKICAFAPALIYLRVWVRSSSTDSHFSLVPSTNSPFLPHLDELYVKIVNIRSLNDAKQIIERCQGSLRRISLDFGENLRIDGNILQELLMPLTSLQTISFISRLQMEKIEIPRLLSSFQSQWWLDAQRPPVLIHHTNTKETLIVSIPSSFVRVLKNFHFSTDLHSWHFNKGTLDTFTNGVIGVNNIYFSTKQPISLEFLQFARGVFHSPRQIIACRYWGLAFEQEYFSNSSQSMINNRSLLPNVTQLHIGNLNGLTPLTLAVWLHLAPNIRTLQIEYLTSNELIEWLTDLVDQRIQIIFQQISRITMTILCYNDDRRLLENFRLLFGKIFPNAEIN